MNPWGVSVPPPTEAAFFNAARVTTFLLVEGGSDALFWEAHVHRRFCQVRAIGGREQALAELRTVAAESKTGFVAVLDADFDRLDGTLPTDENVVWTDVHDLEVHLIASHALDKVLIELGSRTKCENFEAEERCTVRQALLTRAVSLGRLRWLSRRESLGLIFRKLSSGESFRYVDYGKFCDRSSWRVDEQKLVQEVLNFSMQHKLRAADLLERMACLPDVAGEAVWQLCVGHDLVGLLVVGLRSRLGTRNCDREDLEKDLRLSFSRGDLEATGMYQTLRAWERSHPPFRIFE